MKDMIKGKSISQSISDFKGIIKQILGGDVTMNIQIIDMDNKKYKVIRGVLKDTGIEINKGMITSELEHDIIIPYEEIKEIHGQRGLLFQREL